MALYIPIAHKPGFGRAVILITISGPLRAKRLKQPFAFLVGPIRSQTHYVSYHYIYKKNIS